MSSCILSKYGFKQGNWIYVVDGKKNRPFQIAEANRTHKSHQPCDRSCHFKLSSPEDLIAGAFPSFQLLISDTIRTASGSIPEFELSSSDEVIPITITKLKNIGPKTITRITDNINKRSAWNRPLNRGEIANLPQSLYSDVRSIIQAY